MSELPSSEGLDPYPATDAPNPTTLSAAKSPFGTGVTLLRSAPPIVTGLRPWPTRPNSAQLGTDGAAIEALLRRPADT